MYDLDCGFCKIVSSLHLEREKLDIVYESDHVIAFHFTQPFAETHIIIISKHHVPTIFDLSDSDSELKLEMLKAVSIASQEVIALKGACKVEMYLGTLQWVKHLHCHVIFDPKID
jgi:histidine triad (HIT) family protein